jgi:hypothetical protein
MPLPGLAFGSRQRQGDLLPALQGDPVAFHTRTNHQQGPRPMLTIPIQTAKLSIAFPPGSLPSVAPQKPELTLDLGDGYLIWVSISPKSARKLAAWQGSAVLQGRLVRGSAGLKLLDAGFTFIDPTGDRPCLVTI